MKVQLVSLFVGFMAVACAHHPDVRPGDDGVHKVVITGDDQDEIAREALSQANSYCSHVHEKSPAVVSEESKYIGDMDEQTYKNSKRATSAAKVLGGAGVVLGGRNERNAGGVVGVGGIVGDAVIGQGYRMTMKFKCK
jgi:hypothetical protein